MYEIMLSNFCRSTNIISFFFSVFIYLKCSYGQNKRCKEEDNFEDKFCFNINIDAEFMYYLIVI